MLRNYFVSYHYSDGDKTGFFCCDITVNGGIKTMDDVLAIQNAIKNKFFGGSGTVVIINWKPLK